VQVGFCLAPKPPPSLPYINHFLVVYPPGSFAVQIAPAICGKGEGLKNLEPRKFLIFKAILLPPLFKGRVGVGLLGKCRQVFALPPNPLPASPLERGRG